MDICISYDKGNLMDRVNYLLFIWLICELFYYILVDLWIIVVRIIWY